MNPKTSFALLRGILFACTLRDAVTFALFALPFRFPWSVVPSGLKLGIIATLAAYTLALAAFLLRPAAGTKVTLGITVAIALVAIGGVLPAFTHLTSDGFLRLLTGPLLTAAIAFVCFRRLRSDREGAPAPLQLT